MAERKRRKLLSADFKPTAKVNGTVASHSVDSSLNVLVEHVDQGACGHPEFAWRWPQEVLAKLCSHERGIDFSSRLARVCGQGFVMSTACSGLGGPGDDSSRDWPAAAAMPISDHTIIKKANTPRLPARLETPPRPCTGTRSRPCRSCTCIRACARARRSCHRGGARTAERTAPAARG